SSPPQELKEIPSNPRKQEVTPPFPPKIIAKTVESQPTPPLAFQNPCWENENQKINHEGQKKEEPNRKEMIDNLKSWAAKFGITKIPLLVKPTEEVKVKEQVVVKADFIAAKMKENKKSICSKCSVHVGTLLEEDVDPIEVTQSAMEEE
ncbi:hypothetical protein KI387_025238, partial [Taxus chinensis]